MVSESRPNNYGCASFSHGVELLLFDVGIRLYLPQVYIQVRYERPDFHVPKLVNYVQHYVQINRQLCAKSIAILFQTEYFNPDKTYKHSFHSNKNFLNMTKCKIPMFEASDFVCDPVKSIYTAKKNALD